MQNSDNPTICDSVLNLLTELSLNGILAVSANGDIRFANHKAHRLLGIEGQGVDGKVTELLPDYTAPVGRCPRFVIISQYELPEIYGEREVCSGAKLQDGSQQQLYVSTLEFPTAGTSSFERLVQALKNNEASQEVLLRTNRLLAFVGANNKAIIKSKTESELFDEVCRIAVEIGGFAVCWIGKPDMQELKYNPVAAYNASARDRELLASLKFRPDGPTATIVRTGSHYITNDFEKEVWDTPLRTYLWSRGFRSYVGMPINLRGSVYSILNVYSNDGSAFTPEQVLFLEEISNDISFALENLEREALRNEAEKQLQEAKLLQQNAEAIAHLGSWRANFLTGVAYWSDEARRIYGIGKDRINLGYADWANAVHPDDFEAVKNIDDECMRTGSVVEKQHRIIRPDGEIRHVRSLSNYEKNAYGDVTGLYGVVYDVTDRVEAEQALQQSERNLSMIIDMVPQYIFVKDQAHRFLYVNKNYAELYGYEAKDMIGMKFTDILPKGNEDTVVQKILDHDNEIIRTRVAKSIDNLPFTDRKGMQRIFNVVKTHFAVPGTKTEGILAVMEDVTTRIAAEQERAKILNEVLQRNEVLQQFTYIVSHNMRTPIANIIGISKMLESERIMPEMRKQLHAGLLKSAEKMDTVIRDLNDILQIKKGLTDGLLDVKLSETLQDVLTSIDHVVSDNGVRVDFNFDSAPWLHTNKSYLHSVFYNLIINSIKYRHPERQPAIVIRSEKVDSGVVLTFSDNGLGIDMERNGGAIFGLFKRFHNVSDGRGLGLFMVKSQVEAMGGTITVTSTVNTGTSFRVFFPQTKE